MTAHDAPPVTPSVPGGPWTVRQRLGAAGELHALDLGDPASREVWVLTPAQPALVLGSTQPDVLVDDAELVRRGIELVRRRSGGGAVLLDPAGSLGVVRTVWIDVIVPRGDPLWCDDIGRSTDWLGDAWVGALGVLGVPSEVHRGPLERTAAAALVCFAGLGPGEVVAGGRKVVGISQRRTRAGARFQCALHVVDREPGPSRPGADAGDGALVPAPSVATVVELLREPVDPTDRARLVAELGARTGAVAASTDAVVRALLGALADIG